MPLCADCGSGSELLHVSPDCVGHDSSWIEENTQIVQYCLDGEGLFRVNMTADYGRARGLTPGSYALEGEDLPPWVDDLRLVCLSCLRRAERTGM